MNFFYGGGGGEVEKFSNWKIFPILALLRRYISGRYVRIAFEADFEFNLCPNVPENTRPFRFIRKLNVHIIF